MTRAGLRKWNPWPWAVYGWLVLLVIFCVWFVFKSFDYQHDLVTSDYYAAGLDHDNRQTAIARTRQLEQPPRIDLDAENHRLIVRVPDFARDAVLNLYRPSDARMDLGFALQNGVPSVLSTLDLHPGKWQARISWEHEGLDYYHQEDLFLP